MQDHGDLYEILQLHPSAEPDVMQAAHRRLALRYHPDRNSSPEAAGMMLRVNYAYGILSDPELRAAYDLDRTRLVGGDSQSGQASTRPGKYGSSSNQIFSLSRVLLFAVLIVVGASGLIGAVLAFGPEEDSPAPPAPTSPISTKDPIIFSDLDWDSAQLQNRIAMYIVEHGFGYPVGSVSGDSIGLFAALLHGETHVTMEIWLPNSREALDKAVAEGTLIPVGSSIEENWQSAFVIPSYLAEENPGLRSVSDLPKYKGLFSDSETPGKIRLVNCATGQRCKKINEAKIKAYGLEEVVAPVTPATVSDLLTSLEEGYKNRAPWLGYMWGPTKTAFELDLTVLTEPPYSDKCWETDKACAYPTSRIMIAVHPNLRKRAPEVVDFLQEWDFHADSQIAVEGWMEENEATLQEGAIWFLKNKGSVWSQATSSETAQRVQIALER